MQHLEGHLPLEVEVPHPVHPAVPAAAEQREQLVVVAQGAAQALLPVPAVVALPGQQPGIRPAPHRRVLEGARVGGEILQHLGGGEIAVVGGGAQRAQQDPLDGPGAVGAELRGRLELRRVERRFQAGDGEVENRARRCRCRWSGRRPPPRGPPGHERLRARDLARRDRGQGPVAVAQVGHRAAPARLTSSEVGAMRRTMIPWAWACSSPLRMSRARMCTAGKGRGPRWIASCRLSPSIQFPTR